MDIWRTKDFIYFYVEQYYKKRNKMKVRGTLSADWKQQASVTANGWVDRKVSKEMIHAIVKGKRKTQVEHTGSRTQQELMMNGILTFEKYDQTQ